MGEKKLKLPLSVEMRRRTRGGGREAHLVDADGVSLFSLPFFYEDKLRAVAAATGKARGAPAKENERG